MRRAYSISIIGAAAAIAITSACLCAQDGALSIPAAQTTTSPAIDPKYQDLLNRLGSDRFNVREAAQEELHKLPLDQRDVLAKLVAATNDPEIKTRLNKRIDEIDEEMATNPPPITLRLNNASWQQMTDELSKATQSDVSKWMSSGVHGKETFSMSAQPQSFWKILLDLNNQHPLPLAVENLFDVSTEYRLHDSMQNGTISGGFAVFPMNFKRSREQVPQPNAIKGRGELQFSFIVAADPRIKIMKIRPQFFTNIVDSQGNVMLDRTKEPPPEDEWATVPSNVMKTSEVMFSSDKPGLQIASAKGNIHVVLRTGMEEIMVDQPAADKTVSLASQKITITSWDQKEDSSDLAMSLRVEGQGEGPEQGADNLDESVEVIIIDAKDRIIASESFAGTMNMEHVAHAFTPPLRMRLVMTTRTKEVDIPFELKDLPLP